MTVIRICDKFVVFDARYLPDLNLKEIMLIRDHQALFAYLLPVGPATAQALSLAADERYNRSTWGYADRGEPRSFSMAARWKF